MDDISIDGEGMIGDMFRFKDNQVDYVSRWVHTERYKLQKAAKRKLFGRYRNRYTNDPQRLAFAWVLAIRRRCSVPAGLYALKEDDLPHRSIPRRSIRWVATISMAQFVRCA